MKPFFCRVGSKRDIASKIIQYIPLHKKYVEPFIGGGAVFFSKLPSEKEVINDLDSDLIRGYKILKTLKDDDFPKNLTTITKLQRFLDKPARSKKTQLVQEIIRSCNGFVSGIPTETVYKTSDPYSKLKRIAEYQDRLSNTAITSKDYAKVLKEHDGVNTFFYLDPPYEASEGLYENPTIDYEEMKTLLKGLKGKFLLSINNSKYIRDTFKDFHQKRIQVKPKGNKGVGATSRSELLISNYKL